MPYPRDSEAQPLNPEPPEEPEARRRPSGAAADKKGQLAADIAGATGEDEAGVDWQDDGR